MGWKLPLVLVVVAFSISEISTAPLADQSKCSQLCSESLGDFYKYPTGKTYNYNFVNSVQMKADFRTVNVKMTADVKVASHGKCEFSLQLANVNMVESITNAQSTTPTTRSLTSLPALLTKTPVRFAMDQGRVTAFCPDAAETESAANIKRAIISQFQVTGSENIANSVESDVSGECQVYYDIMKLTDTIKINKTRAIEGCTKKHRIISNIRGEKNEYPTIFGQTPVLKGRHECQLTVDNDGYLVSSECTEFHTVKAYKAKTEAVRTHIMQSLKYVDTVKGLPSVKINAVLSSLHFQHAEKTIADNKYEQEQGVQVLKEICKTGFDIAVQAKQFRIVVRSLRSLTTLDQLTKFAEDVEKGVYCTNKETNENIVSFMHDALPYVRTEAAVLLMFQELQGDHLSENDQQRWLLKLIAVKPTLKILEMAKPLLTKSNTHLSIASLVNSYCKLDSKCNTQKAVTDIIDVFITNLGADCSSADIAKQCSIGLALRAIGNLGSANYAPVWTILAKCANNKAVPMINRANAIEAYRRMPCVDKMTDNFVIYKDETADPELRILAFQNLIRCHNLPTVVYDIAQQMNKEKSLQVGSYVWSYFERIWASDEIGSSHLTLLIKNHLENIPELTKKFTLEFYKYSRTMEHTVHLNSLRATGLVQSDLIYSPTSFFPRRADFNFTLDMIGYKINMFDFGLRFENVDEAVIKMQDYLRSSGVPAGQSGANMHNKWKTAKKTTFDLSTIGGQKTTKPEAKPMIFGYGRIFGDEVKAGVVDFTMDKEAIIKAISNKVNGNKNAMLSDISITIPTMAGYPLTLNVETAMSSNSVMTEKLTKMDSKYKYDWALKPRLALHVTGMLTVATPEGSMTTKFNVNSFTRTGASGVITIGDDGITMQATPVNSTSEILNFESNVEIITDKETTSATTPGLQFRTVDKCWSPHTFKLFGMHLCHSSSLPKIKTPEVWAEPWVNTFFSGPARIRLYVDSDKEIKTYERRFLFPRQNWKTLFDSEKDFLTELFFDTPGTSTSRLFQLKYQRTNTVTSTEKKRTREFILNSPWRKLTVTATQSFISDTEVKYTASTSYTGVGKLDFQFDGSRKDKVGKYTMSMKRDGTTEIGKGTMDLTDSASGDRSVTANMVVTLNNYKTTINLAASNTTTGGQIFKKFTLKHETKNPSGSVVHAHSWELQKMKDSAANSTTFTFCQTFSTAKQNIQDLLNIDCQSPATLTIVKSPDVCKLAVNVPDKSGQIEKSRLYLLAHLNTTSGRLFQSRIVMANAQLDAGIRNYYKDRKHFSFESYLVTSAGKNHSAIARFMYDDFWNNDIQFGYKTCSNSGYTFKVNSKLESYSPLKISKVLTLEGYAHKIVLNNSISQSIMQSTDLYQMENVLKYNDDVFRKASTIVTISPMAKSVTLEVFDGKNVKTGSAELGYGFTSLPEATIKLNMGVDIPRINVKSKFNIDLGVKLGATGYFKTYVKYMLDAAIMGPSYNKFRNIEHKTEWTLTDSKENVNGFLTCELSEGVKILDVKYKIESNKNAGKWNRKGFIAVKDIFGHPGGKKSFDCDTDTLTGLKVLCKGIKTEYGPTTYSDLSLDYQAARTSLEFSFKDPNRSGIKMDISAKLYHPKTCTLDITYSMYYYVKNAFLKFGYDFKATENMQLKLSGGFDEIVAGITYGKTTKGTDVIYTEDWEFKMPGQDWNSKVSVTITPTQCKIDHALKGNDKKFNINGYFPIQFDMATAEISVNMENTFVQIIKHTVFYSGSQKKYSSMFSYKSEEGKEFLFNIDLQGNMWTAGPAKSKVEFNYFNYRGVIISVDKNGEYNDNYKLDFKLNVMHDEKKDVVVALISLMSKKVNYDVTFFGKKISGNAAYTTSATGLTGEVNLNEGGTPAGTFKIIIVYKKSLELKVKADKYFSQEMKLEKADDSETLSLLNFKLAGQVDQKFPSEAKGNINLRILSKSITKDEVLSEMSADIDYKAATPVKLKLDYKKQGGLKKAKSKMTGEYNGKTLKIEEEYDIEEYGLDSFIKGSNSMYSGVVTTPSGDKYELTVDVRRKDKVKFEFTIQIPTNVFKKFSIKFGEDTPLKLEYAGGMIKTELETKVFHRFFLPEDPKSKTKFSLKTPTIEISITINKVVEGNKKTFDVEVKTNSDKVSKGKIIILTPFNPSNTWLNYKHEYSIDWNSGDVNLLFKKLILKYATAHEFGKALKHNSELSYRYSNTETDIDAWNLEIDDKLTDGNTYTYNWNLESPKQLEIKGTYKINEKWLELSAAYEVTRRLKINCDKNRGYDARPCSVEYVNPTRKVILRRELLSDGKQVSKISWNEDAKQFIQVTRKLNWVSKSEAYVYLEVINPLRTWKLELTRQNCATNPNAVNTYSFSLPHEKVPKFFKLDIKSYICQRDGDNRLYYAIVESSILKQNMNISYSKKKLETGKKIVLDVSPVGSTTSIMTTEYSQHSFPNGTVTKTLVMTNSAGWKWTESYVKHMSSSRLELLITSVAGCSKCTAKGWNENLNITWIPGTFKAEDSLGRSLIVTKNKFKTDVLFKSMNLFELVMSCDSAGFFYDTFINMKFPFSKFTSTWKHSNVRQMFKSMARLYYTKDGSDAKDVLVGSTIFDKQSRVVNFELRMDKDRKDTYFNALIESFGDVALKCHDRNKKYMASVREMIDTYQKAFENYFGVSDVVKDYGELQSSMNSIKTGMDSSCSSNSFYLGSVNPYCNRPRVRRSVFTYYGSDYYTRVITSMKAFFDEVKDLKTRIKERMLKMKEAMKDKKEDARKLMVEMMSQERVDKIMEAMNHSYLKYLKVIIKDDLVEIAQTMLNMTAYITGKEAELEDKYLIRKALLEGDIRTALRIYFKPEKWSISRDMNANTCILRGQYFVNPLFRKIMFDRSTLFANIKKMRTLTRKALAARIFKRLRALRRASGQFSKSEMLSRIMPPYKSYAEYVARQHVHQYNGDVVYNSTTCTMVLAHETSTSKFSLIKVRVDNVPGLLIQATAPDGTVMHILMSKEYGVFVEGTNPDLTPIATKEFDLGNGKVTFNKYALPLNYLNNQIESTETSIQVRMCPQFGGLNIFCFKGVCSFSVPGRYFGKVVGLLGTNGNDGQVIGKSGLPLELIPGNLIVNSKKQNEEWTLSTKCDPIALPLSGDDESQCTDMLEKTYRRSFCDLSAPHVNLDSYKEMCRGRTTSPCEIATAYAATCSLQGAYTEADCAGCSGRQNIDNLVSFNM